jgi:hypothetical protein
MVTGLRARGINVLIDRHDLPFGEKWWPMLVQFIMRCDHAIFVISSDSAKSEPCQKELSEIKRIGRRLVPVMVRETPIGSLHPLVQETNILTMVQPSESNAFAEKLDIVVRTLRENQAWTQQRRVIDTLALYWEEQRRPKELILTGDQIGEFEGWLKERPAVEPELSNATLWFLETSKVRSEDSRHFGELRQYQDQAGRVWLGWMEAIAGGIGVVGGAIFAMAGMLEGLWAGLVGLAAAGAGYVTVSTGRSAADKIKAKEAFLERFGALADARQFIARERKAEAEAEDRERRDQARTDELARTRDRLKKAEGELATQKKAHDETARAPSRPVALPESNVGGRAPAAVTAAPHIPSKDDPLPRARETRFHE